MSVPNFTIVTVLLGLIWITLYLDISLIFSSSGVIFSITSLTLSNLR